MSLNNTIKTIPIEGHILKIINLKVTNIWYKIGLAQHNIWYEAQQVLAVIAYLKLEVSIYFFHYNIAVLKLNVLKKKVKYLRIFKDK